MSPKLKCRTRSFSNFDTDENRFWARVKKTKSCWEWTGTKRKGGYGILKSNGKMVVASRFSYELLVIPIPNGLIVCHKCDNPGCVNPTHLFLGTHLTNALDKMQKGRHGGLIGSEHPNAILDPPTIRKIRIAKYVRYSKEYGYPAIAKRFGTTPMNVIRIRRKERYRNVL